MAWWHTAGKETQSGYRFPWQRPEAGARECGGGAEWSSRVCQLSVYSAGPLHPAFLLSRCPGQRPSSKPALWETPCPGISRTSPDWSKGLSPGLHLPWLSLQQNSSHSLVPVRPLLGKRQHLSVCPINLTGGCVPITQERCLRVTLSLAFGVIIHSQGYVEAMTEWPEHGWDHQGKTLPGHSAQPVATFFINRRIWLLQLLPQDNENSEFSCQGFRDLYGSRTQKVDTL